MLEPATFPAFLTENTYSYTNDLDASRREEDAEIGVNNDDVELSHGSEGMSKTADAMRTVT